MNTGDPADPESTRPAHPGSEAMGPAESGGEPNPEARPGVSHPGTPDQGRRRMHRGSLVVLLTVAIGFGLLIGFLVADRPTGEPGTAAGNGNLAAAPSGSASPVDLPQEYVLPVAFDRLGPELLAAGAIDYERFAALYQARGRALTDEQVTVLTEGSDEPIVVDFDNAYFLLNFFWAFGLVNENPILDEGPMMAGGAEQVGRFASTGGWTLGTKPAVALYASTPIVTLTPDQQQRLEEVASGVYRPCCDNPTSFPDCNHGMAMLGLLELMASQDVGVDEMFEAAKYLNAFWFPQQAAEVALLLQHTRGVGFTEADAREFVGPGLFSGSGFQGVHRWLADSGLLPSTAGGGGSCGV